MDFCLENRTTPSFYYLLNVLHVSRSQHTHMQAHVDFLIEKYLTFDTFTIADHFIHARAKNSFHCLAADTCISKSITPYNTETSNNKMQ